MVLVVDLLGADYKISNPRSAHTINATCRDAYTGFRYVAILRRRRRRRRWR